MGAKSDFERESNKFLSNLINSLNDTADAADNTSDSVDDLRVKLDAYKSKAKHAEDSNKELTDSLHKLDVQYKELRKDFQLMSKAVSNSKTPKEMAKALKQADIDHRKTIAYEKQLAKFKDIVNAKNETIAKRNKRIQDIQNEALRKRNNQEARHKMQLASRDKIEERLSDRLDDKIEKLKKEKELNKDAIKQERAKTAEATKQLRLEKKRADKFEKRDLAGSRKVNDAKARMYDQKSMLEMSKIRSTNIQAQSRLFTYQEKINKKIEQQQRNLAVLSRGKGEWENAIEGNYNSLTPGETASLRMKRSLTSFREYVENINKMNTVGLHKTFALRMDRFIKDAIAYEKEWMKLNDSTYLHGEMINKFGEELQKASTYASRMGTVLGQGASALGAMRGTAVTIRDSFLDIARSTGQIVVNFGNARLRKAFDQYRKLEMANIGFENFFQGENVGAIQERIRASAIGSPMNASDIADYLRQIAPLAGNSDRALNGVMGMAKLIQYSGGNISTEMNYVIKNIRDVLAKGKANTIDIRQFNRAMPALTKVFEDMGMSEFLKNGELTITEENASKLLDAFAKAGNTGDVGQIFGKTTDTFEGSLEKLDEQIDFLIIDAFEASGALDELRQILKDLGEDKGGVFDYLKRYLQLVLHDAVLWVKSFNWSRMFSQIKNGVKTLMAGFKDAKNTIKGAIGYGKTGEKTFQRLLGLVADFFRGFANGVAGVIELINKVGDSFIGKILFPIFGIFSKFMGLLASPAGALSTGLLRLLSNTAGSIGTIGGGLGRSFQLFGQKLMAARLETASFTSALELAKMGIKGFAEQVKIITTTLEEAKVATDSDTIATKESTVAKKEETVANDAATASEERETAANDAATASEERETAANTASATSEAGESSANLATSMFGIGGAKRKVGKAGAIAEFLPSQSSSWMSTLGRGILAMIAAQILGSVAGDITAGVSGDKLLGQNIGSSIGNVGSMAGTGAIAGAKIGGLKGAAIGGGIGLVVGILKSIYDVTCNIDNHAKEEAINSVDSLKEEVRSGVYISNLLKGSNVISRDIDALNVYARGEIDRLQSLEFEAMSATDIQAEIDKTTKRINERAEEARTKGAAEWKEGAETIWKLWDAGDYQKANEYATFLDRERGWSSYDLLRVALGRSDNPEEQASNILKSSKVDYNGEDLTLDIYNALKKAANEGDIQAKVDFEQLEARIKKGLNDAMLSYADQYRSDLSRDEKIAFGNEASEELYNRIVMLKTETDSPGILWFMQELQDMEAEGDDKQFPVDLRVTEETLKSLDEAKIRFYDIRDTINSCYNSVEDLLRVLGKLDQKVEESQSEFERRLQVMTKPDAIVNPGPNRGAIDSTGLGGPKRSYNGGIIHKAAGGSIGVRGVDTVPAMLQPGEYVVRKSTVKKIGLSAMNALNTGDFGYFTNAIGRQNISNAYNYSRRYINTSNDNRRSTRNIVKIVNNSKGARLNTYYSLANRLS